MWTQLSPTCGIRLGMCDLETILRSIVLLYGTITTVRAVYRIPDTAEDVNDQHKYNRDFV